MVDGVAATDLMTVMFDEVSGEATESSWQPAPEPSDAELLLRTLTRQALNPSEQLRMIRAATRRPRATIAQGREFARAVASASRLLKPLGSTSLVGPVGPH